MTHHNTLLDQIRTERRVAQRQRPYTARRSQLERHRAAIRALADEGASLGDIQFYLRSLAKPSMTVARSTVLRYLRHIGAR